MSWLPAAPALGAVVCLGLVGGLAARAAASGPVAVSGALACPAPAAVAAEAEALLAPTASPIAEAELAGTDDQLTVVLREPGGAIAAERALPRAGLTCDELATAAAAVIASWLSDVHPEFAAAPANLARAAPAPRARAAGAGAGFDVALGLLGSAAPAGGEAGWAAGLWAAAGVLAPGRSLGARLAFDGESERSFSLGQGHAQTRRLLLSLGPFYRFGGAAGSLVTELGAGVVGAWFGVRGTGYPRAESSAELDVGAAAHLLVAARREPGGAAWIRWAPFVGLEAVGWPRARTAVDLGSGEGLVLPRGEISLVLGILAATP